MLTLKDVIEKHDTREGRIFDLFIQGLIILSMITFTVSTSPKVSPEGMKVLRIIEIITVAIFTLEYILRIIVADNKFKYIFSFFGIIDLLAIVPFYISIGLDLRALRSFRLIRLFSMFKLTPYSSAMNRFKMALRFAREEIILFFLFTLILLFISAIGIYYFENPAQPDCLLIHIRQFMVVGYYANNSWLRRYVPDHSRRQVIYLCCIDDWLRGYRSTHRNVGHCSCQSQGT